MKYIDKNITYNRKQKNETLPRRIEEKLLTRREETQKILSYIFNGDEEDRLNKKNIFKHHSDKDIKENNRLIIDKAGALHRYIADIKTSANRYEKNTFIIEQRENNYMIKIVGNSEKGHTLALILNDNCNDSKNFVFIIARTLQVLVDQFKGWKIKSL